MAWKPRTPKWDWRACLTSEEAAIIKQSDEVIDRCRKEMRQWSSRRAPIVNRAIQRAKYEAGAR